jgi:hypothetical protein
MTGFDAESMHRLVKLALDAGEVASPEEAVALFSGYRLRIVLGRGWAETLAGQACFVTAVNTAARAFLGGVEVYGELDAVLRVPLFEGRDAATVALELGATVNVQAQGEMPTLVLGAWAPAKLPRFCVSLRWDGWRAWLTPGAFDAMPPPAHDHPLAGVAAAALGVNEAFLHIRGEMPAAGDRTVGLSLWAPLAVTGWRDDTHAGPPLRYLPDALWLVGIGHLGQAYAWALGMLPYGAQRPHLVLQDFDKAAVSNLSTCLFLDKGDLGQFKVRVVSRRLEAAGFTTAMVERRFGPGHHVLPGEPAIALFGVDNLAARRDLVSAGFTMVVEAGLGSGYRDFRNIRTHTFPGPHSPATVWPAEAAAQPAVDLNDVYRKLAQERNDLCGMTQLASRAVATPFVGALAAALVLAEVLRPLHAGDTHSVLDLQMKDLRHRTGAPLLAGPSPTGFLAVP